MTPDSALAAAEPSALEALDELFALIARLAGELPGDGDTLWQDDAFQRRYQALSVERLGLSALATRAGGDDCLRWALAYRLQTLRDELAYLALDTLGYQALPYPDPLLIDNEGPIGHHLALPLMRALAGYFEPDAESPAVPGDFTADHKSRIAGRVFGTD